MTAGTRLKLFLINLNDVELVKLTPFYKTVLKQRNVLRIV